MEALWEREWSCRGFSPAPLSLVLFSAEALPCISQETNPDLTAPETDISPAVSGLNTSTVGDLYISPRGNDAWPGTITAPFGTLDRVRIAVLKTKVSGRTIRVILWGGYFFLPSTWTFTAQDSGTPSTRPWPGITSDLGAVYFLTGINSGNKAVFNVVFENPLFVDPAPSKDNYNLQNSSPARSIGFVRFDFTKAGRLSTATLKAPYNAPAFPLLTRAKDAF